MTIPLSIVPTDLKSIQLTMRYLRHHQIVKIGIEFVLIFLDLHCLFKSHWFLFPISIIDWVFKIIIWVYFWHFLLTTTIIRLAALKSLFIICSHAFFINWKLWRTMEVRSFPSSFFQGQIRCNACNNMYNLHCAHHTRSLDMP